MTNLRRGQSHLENVAVQPWSESYASGESHVSDGAQLVEEWIQTAHVVSVKPDCAWYGIHARRTPCCDRCRFHSAVAALACSSKRSGSSPAHGVSKSSAATGSGRDEL